MNFSEFFKKRPRSKFVNLCVHT